MSTACANPVEQLYVAHHVWLRDWFRSRLGCHTQAADLAQDTFVRVLMRQEQLRQAPLHQPRAFLRVIAKGLLIDHFRQRDVERAFLALIATYPEAQQPSPEEQELLLETLQQLDAALDELPAAIRRVFLLSQFDGLGYAEIASQMQLSTRTVKRYMQQGFRQCLSVFL